MNKFVYRTYDDVFIEKFLLNFKLVSTFYLSNINLDFLFLKKNIFAGVRAHIEKISYRENWVRD